MPKPYLSSSAQNPYKAPDYSPEADRRTEEEKAKHMDKSSPLDRAKLLQEVFETVKVHWGLAALSPFRQFMSGIPYRQTGQKKAGIESEKLTRAITIII